MKQVDHEVEDEEKAIVPVSKEPEKEVEEEVGGECDHDDIDGEAEEEAEAQRPLRDPGTPTQQEYAEHCLTHIPPRPWCPHCLRGKGKDTPSLRLKGNFAENLVPRVRLDYAFLTENAEDEVAEVEDGEADGKNEVRSEGK